MEKSHVEKIKEILKIENQEHLLQKYDKLNEKDREELLKQIENINFNLMKKLYKNATEEPDLGEIVIEPIEFYDKSKMSKEEKELYVKKGIDSIKNKELAVVTMAGGQGTRLGHNKPKGTYDFGIDKSLFEILCDSLKDACEKYGVYINWYIMTSKENYDDTVEFFEENNYFEYPKNYVKFFVQGQLPMLNEDGDILLTKEGLIKEAANGHGGTLIALKKSGILDEMKEKNIKWVFVSGVDNVLANFADPLLVGFGKSTNSDIVVKSVEKTDPKEKAGVFCKKNGRIGVIEYSEITNKMANMRNDYGSLVYGDLNALLHLFSLDSLFEICEKRLPYHTAYKKANYLSRNGEYIESEVPNAYKFETFIFDSFEMLENVNVLRVKREDEFAPLKNAKGADSPETAKKLYTDYIIKKNSYEEYSKWLNNKTIDNDTKEELIKIELNESEIRDRFYKELEFGTAGLRGIMGAGTNRMNIYTITKATQGLANYIIKEKLYKKGVVICYDTRNHSKEFAIQTALCLNANGIKTYIFENPRPVPFLSYSVRILNATAGIMITASHNPPEYNGYKLFWDKGSQIVGDIADQISEEIAKIKNFDEILTINFETAKAKKLYLEIGEGIDREFIRNVEKLQINSDNIKKEKSDLKIAYTPLHGTGSYVIPKMVEKQGYNNFNIVIEQEVGNGYFPTVEYPNPEEKSANKLVIELAKRIDADLTLATDPDADRLGVGVKNAKGEYVLLTGNQIAIFMIEYLINSLRENKKMPNNPVLISTIVSSKLPKKMAEKNGIRYIETLTGFKYMGEYINKFDEEKNPELKQNFIFGYEESYGFLYGNNVRDKDAVTIISLFLEATAYYKKQNLGILDQIEKIYKKYGYYLESSRNLVLKGEEGANKIKNIMEHIRNMDISDIQGIKVLKKRDYKTLTVKDLETSEIDEIPNMPSSNVIYLELENNSWIAIRPSGTEPKIKFYMGSYAKNREESEKILLKLIKYTQEFEKIEKNDSSKIIIEKYIKTDN